MARPIANRPHRLRAFGVDPQATDIAPDAARDDRFWELPSEEKVLLPAYIRSLEQASCRDQQVYLPVSSPDVCVALHCGVRTSPDDAQPIIATCLVVHARLAGSRSR